MCKHSPPAGASIQGHPRARLPFSKLWCLLEVSLAEFCLVEVTSTLWPGGLPLHGFRAQFGWCTCTISMLRFGASPEALGGCHGSRSTFLFGVGFGGFVILSQVT